MVMLVLCVLHINAAVSAKPHCVAIQSCLQASSNMCCRCQVATKQVWPLSG